jgi:glycosyltransferase involved in cell wall biosynthesis
MSSRSLTDLDQRVVFLRGGPLGPFAAEKVLAFSSNPRSSLLLRSARAVLAVQPRILHGWLLRGNLFSAALSPLLPDTRLVTSERNVGHALTTPLKRALERFVATREHLCVVNSEEVAEAAVARIPTRRPRIRVILPGVREPSQDGPRERCTCLSVGRLEAVKDHQTLLRAWRRVLSADPEATLVVLGEGPERPALERTIRELGLETSANLLGDRDPLPFLRGAKVYVSTSRAEGFSRSMLEALAAGVPVVSTDVGGVRHVPGDAVRRVPVNDAVAVAEAVVELLADGAARARAARAATRAYSRHFHSDRCHRQYRDLYGACLS